MKIRFICKRITALVLAGILCMSLLSTGTYAVQELDDRKFCVTWTEVPVYNGEKQKPVPVVSYAGKELSTSEYTVVYSSNVDVRNDAVAVITGRGDYTGLATVAEFTIQPADIADGQLLYAQGNTYTGAPVEPASITVQNAAGQTLTRGVDYQVICTNNVNVGTATARIIGIGNYTGYIDVPYTIEETEMPAEEEITINVGSHEKSYLVSADKPVTFVVEMGSLYLDGRYVTNNRTTRTLEPGTVQARQTYTYEERECGYKMGSDGFMRYTCTVETHTANNNFTLTVIDPTPNAPEELVAQLPVTQDSDKLFLQVTGKNASDDVTSAVWSSSDPQIATVQDGVVTLKKPGAAQITAQVGELTASWDLEDFAALTLEKNTHVLGFDPEKQDVLLTWKNEVLTKDKDYSLKIENKGSVTLVTVTGINNFCDTLQVQYYQGTNYPYPMPLGDMDCSMEVNDTDALYLLRFTLFPDRYPITTDADVNCDSFVNDVDALYLLRFTLFKDRYPLYPAK